MSRATISFPGSSQTFDVTSGRIARDVSDTMWSFSGEIDGKPTLTDFQKIIIRDTVTNKVLFYGIIPTRNHTFSKSNGKIQIDAYSHEFYLGRQYVPAALILSNNSVDNLYSATTGEKLAPANVTTYPLTQYTRDMLIRRLLQPSQFKTAYQWLIDGITVPNVSQYRYFKDEFDSGIIANDINKIKTIYSWATAQYGHQKVAKTFQSDYKQTKLGLIQEMCSLINYVFYCKWTHDASPVINAYLVPDIWTTATDSTSTAYPVHENKFNTNLGLSDVATTITYDPSNTTDPGYYLMGGITKEHDGGVLVNQLRVRGVNKVNGIESTYRNKDPVVDSTSSSYNPEVVVIEHVYETSDVPTDLVTQATVDAWVQAKCLELFPLFNSSIDVYSCSFDGYTQFEPYQKIAFSGFGTDIISSTMRITKVEHEIEPTGIKTNIKCSNATNFANKQMLAFITGSNDFMVEQQILKEDFFVDLTKIDIGTVTSITKNATSIGGGYGTVVLEGNRGTVISRFINT